MVNFFVAPAIVHEKITRLDRFASLCILAGVILTLCGGSTGTRNWCVCFVCLRLVLACRVLCTRLATHTKPHMHRTVPEILAKYTTAPVLILIVGLVALIGLCLACIAADYVARLQHARLLALDRVQPPDAFRIGTLYCILSALCADVTIVLGKARSVLSLAQSSPHLC